MLQNAINAVYMKSMGIPKAFEEFRVPKSINYDYIKAFENKKKNLKTKWIDCIRLY